MIAKSAEQLVLSESTVPLNLLLNHHVIISISYPLAIFSGLY